MRAQDGVGEVSSSAYDGKKEGGDGEGARHCSLLTRWWLLFTK